MKKRKRKTAAFIAAILVCINFIMTSEIEVLANIGNAVEEEVEEIKDNSLYAKSAVLMDAESGRILYGKNATEQMAMASTTKIMTLLIALEQKRSVRKGRNRRNAVWDAVDTIRNEQFLMSRIRLRVA